jgi:APA family basic amino acid/polyamine antiporter
MLTDLFVFTTWIFYGFGAAGIFILRKKMADTERPYKTWGYPITPILFISFSAFYFGMTMYTDVNNYLLGKTNVIYSMYGLLLTLMGVPIYFYLRKNKNSNSIDNKLVNDVS